VRRRALSARPKAFRIPLADFAQPLQTIADVRPAFSPKSFRPILTASNLRRAREDQAHRQTFFVKLGGWDHHDEV